MVADIPSPRRLAWERVTGTELPSEHDLFYFANPDIQYLLDDEASSYDDASDSDRDYELDDEDYDADDEDSECDPEFPLDPVGIENAIVDIESSSTNPLLTPANPAFPLLPTPATLENIIVNIRTSTGAEYGIHHPSTNWDSATDLVLNPPVPASIPEPYYTYSDPNWATTPLYRLVNVFACYKNCSDSVQRMIIQFLTEARRDPAVDLMSFEQWVAAKRGKLEERYRREWRRRRMVRVAVVGGRRGVWFGNHGKGKEGKVDLGGKEKGGDEWKDSMDGGDGEWEDVTRWEDVTEWEDITGWEVVEESGNGTDEKGG